MDLCRLYAILCTAHSLFLLAATERISTYIEVANKATVPSPTSPHTVATASDIQKVSTLPEAPPQIYDLPPAVNISDEAYPHRIVGGHPISIRQVRWQVAIIVDNKFACGGSIVSSMWVLTAAHCTATGKVYAVRGGTRYFKHGGQTRYVRLIARHGAYNRRTSNNDIAMLRVNRPFNFNRYLRPVQLAARSARLPNSLFLSGWGIVGEQRLKLRRGLRGVNVGLVSRRKCAREYARKGGIPRNSFCAAASGRDSCQGDSGGALVKHGVQYGIVSFGFGCARRRYPGVYTDVRRLRRWITSVSREYNAT